jgi:hypothetical protein
MACTLKSLLDAVLKSEEDWRLRLVRQWPAIVGDLHSKMRLERVANDTVIIGVYDSHWMQELFMLSRVIIRTINGKLGAEHVAKLRFILAPTKEAQKKKMPESEVKNTGLRASMNVHQRKALKTIKDDQLQDALQNFFYRCDK